MSEAQADEEFGRSIGKLFKGIPPGLRDDPKALAKHLAPGIIINFVKATVKKFPSWTTQELYSTMKDTVIALGDEQYSLANFRSKEEWVYIIEQIKAGFEPFADDGQHRHGSK